MKAKRKHSKKAAAQQIRPEIRELYKPEPPRKTVRCFERALLNLVRKVPTTQKLDVYAFAERLVMARIKSLLAMKQSRRRAPKAARLEGVAHG